MRCISVFQSKVRMRHSLIPSNHSRLCNSSGKTLFPYSEMMMKFTRPLEDTASLKGSSLTLRCEINRLEGDVQWLKDGQEICPGRRHTIRAQGRERSITIHQLAEQDSGEYVCESTHDRTSATVTVESKSMSLKLMERNGVSDKGYVGNLTFNLDKPSSVVFAFSSSCCGDPGGAL